MLLLLTAPAACGTTTDEKDCHEIAQEATSTIQRREAEEAEEGAGNRNSYILYTSRILVKVVTLYLDPGKTPDPAHNVE